MELIFKLIGPLMLIGGILTLRKTIKFKQKSMLISGTVMEIQTRPARNNKTAYYPVISYLDPLTSLEGRFESSNPYSASTYQIGDQVEIRYMNEGSHKRLCLNNWFGIWGLPFMLMLFGLLFSGIAAVLFL